jgi:hypothetical protein
MRGVYDLYVKTKTFEPRHRVKDSAADVFAT